VDEQDRSRWDTFLLWVYRWVLSWDLDELDQSRWDRRETWAGCVIWIGFILAALAVAVWVVFSVYSGYRHGWAWTGIVKDPDYKKRTLWDWLDLLIIPVVLTVGGYLFTRSENRATQAIAKRRAQDQSLQAYLDQMAQLLLDKERPLRKSKKDSEERTLARARTLTVLSKLDSAKHKASVLQFLYESRLIVQGQQILDLSGADLSGTDLGGASLPSVDLSGADLSGAYLHSVYLEDAQLSKASLNGANLHGAQLARASLIGASLNGANLHGAQLARASLIGASLRKANLRDANLRGTSLFLADLREAVLTSALLSGSRLGGAKLSRARLTAALGWTLEQSIAADSLEGATMPTGQKYEDWIKTIKIWEGKKYQDLLKQHEDLEKQAEDELNNLEGDTRKQAEDELNNLEARGEGGENSGPS
jgi:uncharacterized protein YjbI with pentapeptide repeats